VWEKRSERVRVDGMALNLLVIVVESPVIFGPSSESPLPDDPGLEFEFEFTDDSEAEPDPRSTPTAPLLFKTAPTSGFLNMLDLAQNEMGRPCGIVVAVENREGRC